MKKIDEKTTLKDVLGVKGAEEVLSKHGVPCVTCPMAKMEMDKLKMGYICNMYGINLFKLLDDLEALQSEK